MPPFDIDLLKHIPDTHQPVSAHQREARRLQRAAYRTRLERLFARTASAAARFAEGIRRVRNHGERQIELRS